MTGLLDGFQTIRQFHCAETVLFNGVYVKATELPWYYLPVYFGVKLPIPILLIYLLGIGWGIAKTLQIAMKSKLVQAAGPGLLVISILFPLLFAIFTGSTVYDGIRHFLFIIPPAACLAGIFMVNLLNKLQQRAS